MLFGFLEVFGGLALLVLGGEGLVRGAVVCTRRLGVPLMITGLTVVAYGAALPELMISVRATSMGYPEMAIGNIIGSNIANILLVLGVATLIAPIAVSHRRIRQDVPLLLGAVCAFAAFAMDGELSRLEAFILLSVSLGYTVHTVLKAHSDKDTVLRHEIEEETDIQIPLFRAVLYILAGVPLLYCGSRILIDGGIDLAGTLGVSQAVVALTVFAFGSCLPELVTAIIAARHNHTDIALGTVVGSNLFNVSFIAGACGLSYAMPVSETFTRQDFYILLGVTGLLWLFAVASRTIRRWQGLVFLGGYVAYLALHYASDSIN